MEKKELFSTFIDRSKGGVPIALEMTGDPKKASLKVRLKVRHGQLNMKKIDNSLLEAFGKGYVANAQEEMLKQGLKLGMANFAQRFPLVSLALQDPNLYMAHLFRLLLSGLKARDMSVFMAVMDTAYKAKEGILPDPLPSKLKAKITLGQYKSWGRDVAKKLGPLAKDFGEGKLENDFFSEMNTRDLQVITKLTQAVADFYTKQAMK
jgi:hypothetical protein